MYANVLQFADGSILIWGPVLALTLACAIGLLVLILRDRRADPQAKTVAKPFRQRAAAVRPSASGAASGHA